MNTMNDESLAAATREILSVSEELVRLKNSVNQHSTAASQFTMLSTSLSELSQTLQKLPDPIAKFTSQGADVVGTIERALAPAGDLFQAVEGLRETVDSLPSAQTFQERIDALEARIDADKRTFVETMSMVSDGIQKLALSLVGKADASAQSVASLERALKDASEFRASDRALVLEHFTQITAGLKELSDSRAADNAKLMERLEMSERRLAQFVKTFGGYAGATKQKLDVLDSLGRRSLLDKLFGRDGTK